MRKKVHFLVKVSPIKVRDKKNWTLSYYSGEARDLTSKGILFETNAPIHTKDVFDLKFSLQSCSKLIEVQAIARFVRQTDAEKIKVGCEFLHSNPEVERYLNTMLILYKA
ncbi:MAG: PilZ domain-containing protein [Bdellovibrionia bacterium]